jgi:hypothetical protein
MFDPFAATEAQARAEPDADGVPDGAFYKWQAAKRITECQSQYEANPIQGIAVCLRARIMPPQWLVHSFLKQFDLVRDADVRTWDEAFGQPYPKSVRLETLRPKSAQTGLRDLLINSGYLDQLFKGPKRTLAGQGLPRTEDGFKEAAKLTGIPVKTIKQKLTKTRKNMPGGKDRCPSEPNSSLNFNDPFNQVKKSSPI